METSSFTHNSCNCCFFALYIAKSGILTEKAKHTNQELIKQRIAVFKDVAPAINDIYCSLSFIGSWKDFTPDKIIQAKRKTDREMNVYRSLFSDSLADEYRLFIKNCFQEFTGFGQPAKIRLSFALVVSNWGGEAKSWKDCFTNEQVSRHDLEFSYSRLMDCFAAELGVDRAINRNQSDKNRSFCSKNRKIFHRESSFYLGNQTTSKSTGTTVKQSEDHIEYYSPNKPKVVIQKTVSNVQNIFEYDKSIWQSEFFIDDVSQIHAGMWIRLSYDPTSSKLDEIAQVREVGETTSGWGEPHIIVARYGFEEERRVLVFSDGAFEKVQRIG